MEEKEDRRGDTLVFTVRITSCEEKEEEEEKKEEEEEGDLAQNVHLVQSGKGKGKHEEEAQEEDRRGGGRGGSAGRRIRTFANGAFCPSSASSRLLLDLKHFSTCFYWCLKDLELTSPLPRLFCSI